MNASFRALDLKCLLDTKICIIFRQRIPVTVSSLLHVILFNKHLALISLTVCYEFLIFLCCSACYLYSQNQTESQVLGQKTHSGMFGISELASWVVFCCRVLLKATKKYTLYSLKFSHWRFRWSNDHPFRVPQLPQTTYFFHWEG